MCPQCGAAILPGARFCGRCGRALSPDGGETPGRVCPACGKPCREGERFCGRCGARLTEQGRRFLASYRAFERAVRDYADEAFLEFMGGA